MRIGLCIFLVLLSISCQTNVTQNATNLRTVYTSELYPWLRNGKSKTEKYKPEEWIQRKCRGCKYDPSLWM